jgi:hypothetical protein
MYWHYVTLHPRHCVVQPGNCWSDDEAQIRTVFFAILHHIVWYIAPQNIGI